MASERGSEGDIKSFAGKRTLLALGELALDVVGQLLVLSVRCRGVLLALLGHGLGVLSNKAKFQSTYPSMEEKG